MALTRGQALGGRRHVRCAHVHTARGRARAVLAGQQHRPVMETKVMGTTSLALSRRQSRAAA